ncbi:hypothetical protein PENNAL_c0098G01379 [Penicillium nalgiovense]|uniref:Cytochrome b5 heme-binding domain-containing protein n=1 Tax=Penicillium nalgiovense TaxID=60175 RepID=A0A1V6XAQ5_PENNA|nr:hypothetical protein PENNAL_c0098G01379 [Penicillium nalgiovense]
MWITVTVNLFLLCICITLVFRHFCLGTVTPPKEQPSVAFRDFSPAVLHNFDGVGGKPVYLAVRGRVFDDGPYENFAGRDASRGLALQSFEEDVLTKDLEGPLDDLHDLNGDQLENLESWEERFLRKYPVVGRLVAEGELKHSAAMTRCIA